MNLNIKLNPEEQAIMDGKSGEVLAKAMKSIVLYGDAFGATKLVDIVGDQHLVTSFGANTIKPYFAMMDELINAGLKARAPLLWIPAPPSTPRQRQPAGQACEQTCLR